jgi:hypothetical protein
MTIREDLCLTGKAAESTSVQDARPVALKGRTIRVRRLRMNALGQRASRENSAGSRQRH